MTAALAAPPPEPDAQEGGWLADAFTFLWDAAASIVPGGDLGLLGGLFLLGWMADQSRKRKKARAVTARPTVHVSWKAPFLAAWSLAKFLYRAARSTARFYGGRELRGPARSTATAWSAGTRVQREDQEDAAAMGSVAWAPPRISLVKQPRRQPSPWARKAAAWLRTYSGKGSHTLDRAVAALRWTFRAADRASALDRAVWRGLTAAYRTTAPILGNWPCWPYAARGLVRVILTALLVFALVPAWDVWAVLVAVLATAALGALLPRMAPIRPGDDVVYGPRLWVVLREDLKLPDEEEAAGWLQLPARLDADDARIALRLPWTFRGSDMEKESI
ncbi:hypothetical protein ACFVWE_32380, partial [Streptomyces albidoflavus]